MSIDRRTFLRTLALSPVGLGWSQTGPVPSWVFPGSEPFFYDSSGLLIHRANPIPSTPVEAQKSVCEPSPLSGPPRDDPGDTAQREGLTWFALRLLQELGVAPIVTPTRLAWTEVIKLLEIEETGLFRRHPTNEVWKAPADFSRDQQIPIVAALGAWGPTNALERMWREFDARGRVCQNGELGGSDHQNLFRRALLWRSSTIGPAQIEAFGEFQLATMVASIAGRGSADLDDVGDDLNFLVNLALAAVSRPTKTSNAVMCEYVRTRPVNYGCYLERYRANFKNELAGKICMVQRIEEIMKQNPAPECHPIIGALRWYFRAEAGEGVPAFPRSPWGPAALWEQVIQHLFLPKCGRFI